MLGLYLVLSNPDPNLIPIRYAEARGIRVVGEIDTPGHGAAWCTGMPGVCPSVHCSEPLDVSNPLTFQTIGKVLHDLFTVLPDQHVHLGGDEARCLWVGVGVAFSVGDAIGLHA
jgi:N-acetyl-beta-hexosaminidase